MAGVAIVCSMAGVASGLALAATLMAVQIADRPEVRASCWRHGQAASEIRVRDASGWLGIKFVGRRDGAHVRRVFPNTAAAAVGLQAGDVIRVIDGEVLDYPSEIQYLIRQAGPGAQPTLLVERGAEQLVVRPMLSELPQVIRR